MRRAVFLDRDGTINTDKEYLADPNKFDFIPGAAAALRRLQDAGFCLIITTNQSGVARGYYTEADYAAVTRRMVTDLATKGVVLTDIQQCFHHENGRQPYNIVCGCRKPKPGMVHAAKKKHLIDLSKSFVVGDKVTDVEMGINAGIPASQCLLVKTGKGGADGRIPAGVVVVDDLSEAAAKIVGHG